MRAEPVAATLAEAAVGVLTTPAPVDKVASSRRLAEMWRSGAVSRIGTAPPPARPARPARPPLLRPGEMPRRRIGRGRAGRVALIHALAHIELNAIDLAWDMVARFTAEHPPRAFYDDWVVVAAEEARHHEMLAGRRVVIFTRTSVGSAVHGPLISVDWDSTATGDRFDA